MGFLQQIEGKLESAVSTLFARTFRSAVQPVEISAALNRELDSSAQILSRDRRLVPNEFRVELSGSDFERLDALGATLNQELVDMLRTYANEQSYVFTGPVHIRLVDDDKLPTGRLRVRSRSVSNVTSSDGEVTDTGIRRASALLEINGEKLPLSAPGIVIGRGSDADLRIDDPGVSRRHIEIRVHDGPNGAVVNVHDLGSTNGMLVDGRRLKGAQLEDGSTVRIGNTTMSLHLVHSTVPRTNPRNPQRP